MSNFLTAKWLTPKVLGQTKLSEFEKSSLIVIYLSILVTCTVAAVILMKKISNDLPCFLIFEKLNFCLKEKKKILTKEITLISKQKTF